METNPRYLLVGSFVLVLLAGLVVVVMWLARFEFRESANYYDIYFTGSVTGLNGGSVVRENGISVGRVTEIRLDPLDPTRVRVTVQVNGRAEIRSDAVASLETQGLTGAAFINITGGSRGAPTLEREPGQRYPVIASEPSGLQRVVTSAPEALARLIALTDELKDVLNEHNRQSITETLDNLRQLTAAMAKHSSEIDSALSDGTAALHDLRDTLDSAHAILVSLNAMIAPKGDMAAAIRSVNATSRKFAATADQINALLDADGPDLNRFLRQEPGQIQQLISQTQTLVAQLNRIADEIERNPSSLIYGDQRQGYRPR